MIRFVLLAIALPTVAVAGLPTDVTDRPPEPPALAKVAVPCLRDREERRYLVTWEIRNTETGERRDVGSQEVRLRC